MHVKLLKFLQLFPPPTDESQREKLDEALDKIITKTEARASMIFCCFCSVWFELNWFGLVWFELMWFGFDFFEFGLFDFSRFFCLILLFSFYPGICLFWYIA